MSVVLYTELPYAAVCSAEWMSRVCCACFRADVRVHACAKCRCVWYCGKACQERDWREGIHSKECVLFRQLNAAQIQDLLVSTQIRLITRLLLKSKYDKGFNAKEYLEGFSDGLEPLSLESLKEGPSCRLDNSQPHVFKEMIPEQLEHFKRIYKATPSFLKNVTDLEFEQMFAIAGSSAFPILKYNVYSQDYLGKGIYVETSHFPHSCEAPDLQVRCDGAALRVLGPKPLAAFHQQSYDKLSLSRFFVLEPLLLSPTLRLEILKYSAFMGHCECELCSDGKKDDWRRYCLARSCQCGQPLVVVPEQDEPFAHCRACGRLTRLPNKDFFHIRNTIRKAEKFFLDLHMGLNTKEDGLEILEEAKKGVLHLEDNTILLSLQKNMLEYLLESSEIPDVEELAIPFGDLVLFGFKRFNIRSSTVAVLCTGIAKLNERVGNFTNACVLLEDACQLWRECDETHPCVGLVMGAMRALGANEVGPLELPDDFFQSLMEEQIAALEEEEEE